MAFQKGSTIDPRLMKMDYSGFTNAADIQAQTMSNIGSQIGGAIKTYIKNKEEKQLTGQAAEFLLGLPGASNLGVTDIETAKVAIKSLGGVGNAMQALNAMQAGQANTAATTQATAQSASAFPGKQAMSQAQLDALTQATAQSASAFPVAQQMNEAQLNALTQTTAQSASAFPTEQELLNQRLRNQVQAFDQSASMFPEQMRGAELGNEAAQQGIDLRTLEEQRAAEMFPYDMRGKQQVIASSIASMNNAAERLELDKGKIAAVEASSIAEMQNANAQAELLNQVMNDNMSTVEYIQSGGDMDALRKARDLTKGQTPGQNAAMITAIEEHFSYLKYDEKTNTWLDRRGKNRSGLSWQQLPELEAFMGTQESQQLSDQGFTLGKTYN